MNVLKALKWRPAHAGKAWFLAASALFLSVFVLGLVLPQEANALRISMKRIVFEGKKRSDILTIVNNSTTEQIYRIGWRHYVMTEDEALKIVPDEQKTDGAGKMWADEMIRYAPRRVTVAPGSTQQIRLMLRRPRDLEEGEYRSHLWIITETPPEPFATDPEKVKGKQAVRLNMQPGISLPVFVRNGNLEVSVSLEVEKVQPFQEDFGVVLYAGRDGNRSVYGDFDFVCTGSGDDIIAHRIRGMAIYTDVTRRKITVRVPYPEEGKSACKTGKITYTADKADGKYGGQVMATTQFTLP